VNDFIKGSLTYMTGRIHSQPLLLRQDAGQPLSRSFDEGYPAGRRLFCASYVWDHL